jgi:hypothetical protein
MRPRRAGLLGVLLAAATIFTIAVSGAHAHARGDAAAATCAVCTLAHLPAIDASTVETPATSPEALLTYRAVRADVACFLSVPERKSRAPPV